MFKIRLELVKNELDVHAADNITYSNTGYKIYLRRWLLPYIFNIYLPTGILVLISFISFAVPGDQVPGRMALIITVFLMLVNISMSLNRSEPKVKVIGGNTGAFRT